MRFIYALRELFKPGFSILVMNQMERLYERNKMY